MCGIIGVVTKKTNNIADILTGALSRLEYRGYDSAGIALSSGEDVCLYKCVGAPSSYLRLEDIQGERYGNIGIGHNRWATHGKPSIENAHPHTDTFRQIVVVHNGTILNYEVLKRSLIESGVTFISETDTEVIPHLIARYRHSGMTMEQAFIETVSKLEGAYGIVAFAKEDPTTLYAAKEGSPIVIGKSEDAFYVASSVHGFLPFTERYMSLLDGEIAIIKADSDMPKIIHRHSKKNIPVRIMEKIEIRAEDVSRGDYETFMLKEIFEQPTTTQASLLGRIDEERGVAVLGGLLDHKHILENNEHILITGCGTAYHAGEIGSQVIEAISSINVRCEISSEGKYKTLHLPKQKTAVIAVSQSGETADTIEYLKELDRKGYPLFGVVNVVGSAISQLTGKGVYTKAGVEIGVASTKAFTSQLAVLYLFALYIARMGSLSEDKGIVFAKALSAIPSHMKSVLDNFSAVEKLVSKYKQFTKIQFLGRGIHFSLAKEAALKFKEITYMESGAYPLGELKHGPIAVIDEETLSIVFLPKDSLFEQGVNSIEQIKSKGGKVVLITDESTKNHPITQKVDDVVFVPHIEEPLLYPLLEILPVQLFAYYFAKYLGRNIDKPRNLAKSVTVQ